MKYYKNKNDILKSFYSSAENVNRVHPLEYIVEKKENKASLFMKKIFKKIKYKKDEIFSFFVRKSEDKFYRKNNFHTERAVKEYLEYYENLYFSKLPDLKNLVFLLKRNGSPDIPNPYKLGQENFFKYNEYGLMATEVEVILNYIIKKMKDVNGTKLNEEEEITEKKEYVSDILDYFDRVKKKKIESEENNYQAAMQCWALIAKYGNGCDFLMSNIDINNIHIVTAETILNVNCDNINENIEDIVECFYKYNYIDKVTALEFLEKRKMLNN